MSEKIPIKPLEEIQFGKTMLATDLETSLFYFVYCYKSASNKYVNTSHKLWVLLTACQTALERISSPSIPTSAGTATVEVGLRNLCRLARNKYEGDTLTHMLTRLSVELALLPDGTTCATKTLSDLFIEVAKYAIGGDMQGFVGTWDNQKYAVQDEIGGGIWLTFFYITTLWNLHLSSWITLMKSIGEFTSDAAAVRGNFKQLMTSDPKTWGALLVAQENSTSSDIFDMTTSILDNPSLRSIDVIKVSGFESLATKLLSRSRWTWRFGRWIEVIPLYFICCPQVTAGVDGIKFAEWSTELALFNDITSKSQWRTWNNTLLEFRETLTNHFFHNKSYGALKAKFSKVPFGLFPTLSQSGNGGILAHQMIQWVEALATGRDDVYHKFLADTDNLGHKHLAVRRTFNAEQRFLLIGDGDASDYRLHHGATFTHVWDSGAATAVGGESWLRPISMFCFGIGKTEDETYKIGRVVYDLVNTFGDTNPLKELPISPWTWEVYSSTEAMNAPISLQRTKTLYYESRAVDPYKKLKHKVYDVNELDIDIVLKEMRSYFWPLSASTSSIDITPIPVSAMPMTQVEVSDDVNTKKETTPGVEQPVSAKLIDKKDIKESKK